MNTLLRRILRLDRRRAALTAEFESEGVIHLAERVPVVCRFSGSIPGLHSAASVFRSSGALIVTNQRVVATLPIRSDPSARAVDCRWDASQPGPLKIEISADGVMLDLDVRRVDHSFQGHLSLHYEHDISTDVLARLPRTSLRQAVTADFVCGALGVRHRAPSAD